MTSFLKKWEKQKNSLGAGSVVYLSGTNAELLREAETQLLARWAADGGETPTRLDGPVPDIGELIATVGAISLFGGCRRVVLRELSPSSLSDKDAKELEELFGELENAMLLVTALHKDKRAAASKKAKALFAAAQSNGLAAELSPPTRQENLAFLHSCAEECGARFGPGAAEELLDRAGAGHALLKNETEKLAAMAGYGQIEAESVKKYGARNIEADVFELMRLITQGRRGPAQEKLAELLALRNEPVAIAAGLGGGFVDMLRVRVGAENRRSPAEVFHDMGYKGNEYRMVKAKENAARYKTGALEEGVLALAKLDKALKSNPLSDKGILLQLAVEDLIRLREAR